MKKNQPTLYAQVKNLPWRNIPAGHTQRDRGHRREEHRTLKAATVTAGLVFPYAAQALCLTRGTRPMNGGKWRTVTVYAIASLDPPGGPSQLASWICGHWQSGAAHIRDVSRRRPPRSAPATDPRPWPPAQPRHRDLENSRAHYSASAAAAATTRTPATSDSAHDETDITPLCRGPDGPTAQPPPQSIDDRVYAVVTGGAIRSHGCD